MGVGVAPKTYVCPVCRSSMIRAAETIRKHEAVHGNFITLATAHRMGVEGL
jgi:adenylyl- and sulfurtransferase ThiI